MVTDKPVFTACVHRESDQWKISIREQYGPRSEFIVRSDITVVSASDKLEVAWSAVDEAGWFVDRVSSRVDPDLVMTVANVTPRIPSEIFTAEWVFVARAMARGVPFSVARRGFMDGFTEPVEFAEHYIWEHVLQQQDACELHHVND